MKIIKFVGALIISIILFAYFAKKKEEKFEFYSYCNSSASLVNPEFLYKFPYVDLIKICNIRNVNQVEKYRSYIQDNRGIGNDFICSLIDSYLSEVSKSQSLKNAIYDLVLTGEIYLSTKPTTLNQKTGEIYDVIGYYILGRVSSLIVENQSDFNAAEFSSLRDRLKKHKVYLNIEEDFITKIKNAPPGYLWRRFKSLFITDERDQINLSGYTYTWQPHPQKIVSIFAINQGGNIIGKSIWMSRPEIKAKYFASGNAYKGFYNFALHNKVLFFTSGGYSNNFREPEGITIENGDIINSVILPGRDALVIVEKNGGLRVCNLGARFSLPNLRRKINPRNSLIDYTYFINWCRQNSATVFQTHLLVYSDEILIDPEKAPKKIRERRFLVCVRDDNEKLHHVLFHITKPKALANLTFEIYDAMKRRGKKIESIINLDVGQYDILTVYDALGNQVSDIKGKVSNASIATNLLVYHF